MNTSIAFFSQRVHLLQPSFFMHESAGNLLLSKRNFPLVGTLLSKEKVSACGNGHVLAHSCGVHLRYIAAQ